MVNPFCHPTISEPCSEKDKEVNKDQVDHEILKSMQKMGMNKIANTTRMMRVDDVRYRISDCLMDGECHRI